MKVVFLEDVIGVAQGGDVKEVKNGFARNYLIPKNLAVPATHNALQRVARIAKESEVTRLTTLTDMKALAEALNETQVNVEMRAGTSGRLYGSVTNAIIAEQLTELVGQEIDRRTILLAEPLRELGIFDIGLRLHPEVDAEVKVVVHAIGSDPDAVVAEAQARAEAASEEDDEDEEPTAEVAVAEATAVAEEEASEEEVVAEVEEPVAELEEETVAEAEEESADETEESDE
jgi:large subunit ribosomal protein L9